MKNKISGNLKKVHFLRAIVFFFFDNSFGRDRMLGGDATVCQLQVLNLFLSLALVM